MNESYFENGQRIHNHYYEEIAKKSDDYQYHIDEDYYFYKRLKDVIRTLPDHEPLTVLDVGCGSGALLKKIIMKNQSTTVIGTDISWNRIHYFHNHASGLYGFVADAQNMPCRAQIYDVIFLNEVLEHVSNTNTILNELARIIKPKGHFIMTIPVADWYRQLKSFIKLKVKYLDEVEHFREYSYFSMRRFTPISYLIYELEKNGFQLIRQIGSCFWVPFLMFKPVLNHILKKKLFKIINVIDSIDTTLGLLPGIKNFGVYQIIHCKKL